MNNDSLKEMCDEVNDVLDKHNDTLCDNPRYKLRKLKVSNPQVLCLFILMKTHKDVDDEGDMKARPVTSNTNAPTEFTVTVTYLQCPSVSQGKVRQQWYGFCMTSGWNEEMVLV